ncbi:MAG: imidazolonepropionase [Bacteriovoracia bacterium]
MAKIFYTDISELVTNAGVKEKNGKNITESDLRIIQNAALLWDDKKGIVWFGPKKERTAKKDEKKVSLDGRVLTPALVDCHTHLVHGGSRHDEFQMRLEGKSYQEIAQSGGGIQNSVGATRLLSKNDLVKKACVDIEKIKALGVGILEIKSGYGLNLETEIKQLEAIQALKNKYKKEIVIQSTFLGAHANASDAYTNEIVNKMLPVVAKKNLADACDAFFDEGYFNRAQTKKILEKAKTLGLKLKLHADELADTGGASLAAELKVLSADHLLKANLGNLKLMAKNDVVAVLLPTTAFYLGLPYADLKKMRQAQVCMALASDYNPGSSPTFHMPFVMSLSVLSMGMTLPEAFAAATFGGAKALGLQETHGHLEIGKKPKMAIFDIPSYKCLIQQVANPSLCSMLI